MIMRAPPAVGETFNEKGSWFGNCGAWVDPEDNGENASGLPETTPGIAFLCKETLKHWWLVAFPNGKTIVVQQVDVGPGSETGRGIDINTVLATKVGYTIKSFPTGANIKFTYLGEIT